MGVIGRLDDQVEEVIINPIGERNRRESVDRQPPPQPAAEPQQAEEPVNGAQDKDVKEQRSSDLPVWLL